MTQKTTFFPLGGGLDLTTPAISVPSGRAIASLNYEAAPNGYQRLNGYERFDGHTGPTAAGYWYLSFDAGVGAITAGQTVTGQTSGATGIALANATVLTGSYGASNATGYLGLGAVTGTFLDNENLRVGGVTKSVANGAAVVSSGPDDTTEIAWQLQATTNARALIAAVPGSGPVRGIWYYNGVWYAFRDNAGATAGVMYKATAAGWVAVTISKSLSFTSGGVTEITIGQTITGATSGATGVIAAVVLRSGSWSAGTAAGYFIINTQTGTFQAEDVNVGAALNLATIAGNSSTQAFPAGGRYNFINHNFYGASDRFRMYGCNGVGKAFEFDGTTLTFITTGMALDTPHRIVAHKQHLFLAFTGGSVQHSSPGSPLVWNPILGAAELAVGDEITDFIEPTAGALVILSEGSINVLYGNGISDWVLDVLTAEAGGHAYTAQKMGTGVYMDNRGIRSLSTTQQYGNFNIGTMTQLIKPLLQQKTANGVAPCGSSRARAKDIYRVFFDDNSGLSVFVGKKSPEVMPFDLGKLVTCIASIEDDNNEERTMFGSTDGFVYEMDKGRSFDGSAIPYFVRLPFNHVGAPHIKKRWHKAALECEAGPLSTLMVSAEFDYGSPFELGLPAVATPTKLFSVQGGGGLWDVSNWDQFYWSAALEGTAEAYLDGVGKNMSLLIAGETSNEVSHLLQGVTLFFSVRGLVR